ncbi:hypothetical protein GCM10017559_52400 [Streptosporangium longisporum]|uniref:Uncharacterized protein n=1 Tax=Streptosporangium longisporum TaxID=46187 RepID=A0ABP6KVL8_9ACTN
MGLSWIATGRSLSGPSGRPPIRAGATGRSRPIRSGISGAPIGRSPAPRHTGDTEDAEDTEDAGAPGDAGDIRNTDTDTEGTARRRGRGAKAREGARRAPGGLEEVGDLSHGRASCMPRELRGRRAE